MKEIWKNISGYDGLYQISNFGRIKNSKGNIKISQKQNSGYLIVHLYKDGKRKALLVHRIVAETFLTNSNHKKEVNHINGDKNNNRVDNLEWVTPKENQRHSRKILLRVCGEKPKKIKCTETGEYFFSIGDAALHKNISHSCISRALSGDRGIKTAGGYHWEYAN